MVRYLSLPPQDSPGLLPLGSDGSAGDAWQAEFVHALKAGGGASKADVDATIEALKALKVEAGAAAHWLQQALGAADGAAREDLRQAFFFSGSGSVRRLALRRRVASAAALHGMPPA